MNYDIVGTLNQPYIALSALLLGAVIGFVCAILKLVFTEKNKLFLIIGDVLCSFLFGASNMLFSFFFTQGVIWAYTIFCSALSFCIVYLGIKKGFVKLFRQFRKKKG